MQSEIKADWTVKMSAHTASRAYASQNGKPVVCILGFGYKHNDLWDASACLDVVNWFKAHGCYVIGRVPREWRTGDGGSRTGFSDVYHAFNMISPWMVGVIGNGCTCTTAMAMSASRPDRCGWCHPCQSTWREALAP